MVTLNESCKRQGGVKQMTKNGVRKKHALVQ